MNKVMYLNTKVVKYRTILSLKNIRAESRTLQKHDKSIILIMTWEMSYFYLNEKHKGNLMGHVIVNEDNVYPIFLGWHKCSEGIYRFRQYSEFLKSTCPLFVFILGMSAVKCNLCTSKTKCFPVALAMWVSWDKWNEVLQFSQASRSALP